MPSDPAALSEIVSARRDDAAQPPAAAVRPGDLMEIAAALERIKAEIAAGDGQKIDVFAAIERIQDIAFVLHERPVEATLCDTLDAAIREVSDACARLEGVAQRTRDAHEQLHSLAARVSEMIALSAGTRSADLPAADPAVASIAVVSVAQRGDATELDDGIERSPSPELFAVEAQEDDDFAMAVAELATSLPAHGDSAEPDAAVQSQIPAVVFYSAGQGGLAESSSGSSVEPRAIEPETVATEPGSGESTSASMTSGEPDVSASAGDGESSAVASGAAAAIPGAGEPSAQAEPASRPMSVPRPGDPLAAVRELSEEELIALFS